MTRTVKIRLDEDTAEFLELMHAGSAGLSDYINSLLRQERFRQGYPQAIGPDLSRQPARRSVETLMLERSGLLPFPPRR